MKQDTLVIIPTYNEAHNVRQLIHSIMGLDEPVDILFVDDGSPDNTAGIIKEERKNYPDRVYLKEREGKLGLGTAYVAGFQYALANDYQYICEMDADFSHDPNDLPRLIEKVRSGEADVAVGSRYSNGISIINWPLSRLILSYSANLYVRCLTGLPLYDTTAGFKCINRKVLESIKLSKIRSNGYAFQIEIHFRAWKRGFKLDEVSIIFRERKQGESKMSKSIVREAIWRVWALKLQSIMGLL